MISIFNGRTRGLGKESAADIYLQVSVSLRQHLHLFKGSKLGVFMAIALHSDQDGWSRPSLALLRHETGYNKETISQAVTELCQLEIAGERVLLVVQERLPSGLLDVNRYLVFPTKEEVEKYEGEHSSLLRKARIGRETEKIGVAQPRPEKPYMVEPDTVAPYPVNPEVSITKGKKNKREVEPKIRTPTRIPACVAPVRTPSAAECVRRQSKFGLDECLQYANHLRDTGQGITNPGGYATMIQRSGEVDVLIDKFIRSASDMLPAAALANKESCPDCQGTGYWYPAGTERGVARCKHPRLTQQMENASLLPSDNHMLRPG